MYLHDTNTQMRACMQVLLVSTIWNTRHAAVEVCTKEMAPETRSCADADSFVAVNPSGLEHDHKGVSSRYAAAIPAYANCCFNMLAALRYPQTDL